VILGPYRGLLAARRSMAAGYRLRSQDPPDHSGWSMWCIFAASSCPISMR